MVQETSQAKHARRQQGESTARSCRSSPPPYARPQSRRAGERRRAGYCALAPLGRRAVMSGERPPRTDIPRNLSFIAALTERAYYRSQRPSLEEESEEEPGEGGTRPGARSRAHVRDRGRRARSAPAGGSGARAARSRSPDTRKRVRFADALGLELAVVRRFRPGEPPRVPRHVQVQLQRDALRHFAPCPPRARGLQVGTPPCPALHPHPHPGNPAFALQLRP